MKWETTVTGPPIEWSEVKDRLCLGMVATNLLGPAHQRRGDRLFWLCPFHDEKHPSFEVSLTKKLCICRSCGKGGDSANFVMEFNKCDFPAAVRFLAGLAGVITSPSPRVKSVRPTDKPPVRPPEKPTGLPLDEASSFVADSVASLWEPGGENARDYLRGRGLTDETIRAAGLGFTPCVMVPTKEGDRCFRFSGVTIPWRDRTRLTKVKIRRFPFPDLDPRYAEAYSDRPLIFPDPAAIRPGKPLIVCEGEFDCLLLGQQLPEASVITLGSASARTDPVVLSRMLSAPRWFIALDADQAGDTAASKFPARAIRVCPPVDPPLKDWGDVHREGANRIRYHWGRYLPMSKKWEEMEPKGDLA
jgi:DNA primase